MPPNPISIEPSYKICLHCKQQLLIKYFRPYKNRGKTHNINNIPYTLNRCIKCTSLQKTKYKETHLEYADQERINGFRRLKEWKIKNKGTIQGFIYSNLNHWRQRTSQCNLDTQYLLDLWETQKGQCYYTGVKLETRPNLISNKQLNKTLRTINDLSLDRLIPELGYIKGNVVWCSFKVNLMKSNFTKDEFINFCTSISNRFIKR